MAIKKKAIIVDIDGTLADASHRLHFLASSPKRWDEFHRGSELDEVNTWCTEIIERFSPDHEIILLTGRGNEYREVTKNWLKEKAVTFNQLFMRANADRRSDFEVKKEIFLEKITEGHDVLFVIEDRMSVVAMWRELGLICLQCAKGDF